MYLATSAGGSARGGRSEDGASGGSVAVETGCAADSTFGASCILARRPHGGERLARDGGRRVDCSTAVWNSRQFLLFTLPLQASASVVAFCPRGPVHGQRVVWTPVSVTRTAPTMSSHTRSNFSICLTDSGIGRQVQAARHLCPCTRSKTQADISLLARPEGCSNCRDKGSYSVMSYVCAHGAWRLDSCTPQCISSIRGALWTRIDGTR